MGVSATIICRRLPKRLWPLVAFTTLSACAMAGSTKTIAPFSDRPDEVYEFRFTQVNIPRKVWLFDSDGSFANNNGPVGFSVSDVGTAVAIVAVSIELQSAFDVVQTDPAYMLQLMEAAEQYCIAIGKDRIGSGANVFTDNGALFFEGFC